MISSDRIIKNYHDYFLLDVRTPHEFSEGHIPGSINIPIDQLDSSLSQIPKNRHIITICNYGNRSGLAETFLQSRDYQADKLEHGLSQWPGQITT